MNIEQEHGHIVSFINGFESIVKQHQFKHYVDVGGVESYAVGVMRAEGVSVDLITGAENFISNGIKKLWEMVSNFAKNVWGYFFGSEKKAETAVKEAEDVKKVSAEVKSAVSSGKATTPPPPSAPPAEITKHYANIAKINKHALALSALMAKATTYFDPEQDIMSSMEQMKRELLPKAEGRIASILSDLAGAGTKMGVSMAALNNIQNEFKAYQVPQGNRVDTAALTKLLTLVNGYSGATKLAVENTKDFLSICSTLVAEVKNQGSMDEQLAGRILRMIQISQAKGAGKLKRFCRRIEEIKTECDILHSLVFSK